MAHSTVIGSSELPSGNKKSTVQKTDKTENHAPLVITTCHEVCIDLYLVFSSFSIAPSGMYKMGIVTEKNKDDTLKQYLHIWNLHNRNQVFDIEKFEVHGKINEDDTFETFEWSKDEHKILYTAERFVHNAKSFLKKPLKCNAADQTRYGEEYLYREDWGEALVGKCCPIPCILNLDTEEIICCNFLPDNVSFGQSVWNKDGEEIISVGWFHENQKLGLVYCDNRRFVKLDAVHFLF
ncbi:Acylamino-acid-releasing enzyme [Nymphon striatum]|nr:Acylamino-acid-releasing enzyme [Nymphon striatum]